MTHPSPARASRRPLVIVAVIVAVALATGLTLLVVSSRTGSDNPSDAVPQEPVASTEALSGSRACERAAQRVLVRYGTDIKSGAPGVVMVTPEESDALDQVPYARDAFLVATTDYTTLVGPWGSNLPVPEAVSRVMPQVRRVCQQAG